MRDTLFCMCKSNSVSTLGFMMAPAQYGMAHYGSPHHLESPSDYPPMTSTYTESKYTSSTPYSSTYAPPHSLSSHDPSRRSTDLSAPHPSYQAPSLPRSPYQQSMAPVRTSNPPLHYPATSNEGPSMLSSAPQSYQYSAQSNLPGQPLGSNSASYPPPPSYPTSSYTMSDYTPLPTSLYPATTSPASFSQYEHPSNLAPTPSAPVQNLSSNQQSGAQPTGVMPRILNSRPKPQCWEHGCNGRQFSTFSNLLRHQREKSGTAAKSSCPRCGAEFTRTTARNGHMTHEKCKARRTSDSHR
ncbi:hypothetical protein CC80DRAFT_472038 [Byssothecium circinans]|uniref:C2H2-type domain-containing protein n=1 Tax=Byssothecium circinans TaxID=147558 RepID=A0A6A5TY19_9PLEO|nr:hypothetical protein CC80DRAFT_472038 [Byssothecium circinans]